MILGGVAVITILLLGTISLVPVYGQTASSVIMEHSGIMSDFGGTQSMTLLNSDSTCTTGFNTCFYEYRFTGVAATQVQQLNFKRGEISSLTEESGDTFNIRVEFDGASVWDITLDVIFDGIIATNDDDGSGFFRPEAGKGWVGEPTFKMTSPLGEFVPPVNLNAGVLIPPTTDDATETFRVTYSGTINNFDDTEPSYDIENFDVDLRCASINFFQSSISIKNGDFPLVPLLRSPKSAISSRSPVN